MLEEENMYQKRKVNKTEIESKELYVMIEIYRSIIVK